jgi:hypothetical protein
MKNLTAGEHASLKETEEESCCQQAGVVMDEALEQCHETKEEHAGRDYS